MKHFLSIVFVCLLCANFSLADEAAFPSQELGSKPPVLTGTAPLSEAELQEGWIRLFDGVSTFGWMPLEGEYSVRNGLLVNSPPKSNSVLRYGCRFLNCMISGERRPADGSGDWTPFQQNLVTNNVKKSGVTEFTLESGQFRDIKLKPEKMQSLFNGKDLTGWKIIAEAKAAVEDGTLRLTDGLGSVETEESFGDFVLQLEYRTDKAVNSGVFFRCIPGEKMNGYEVQVFNNPPDADYKKFIGTDTGGIFRRQVGRNMGPKDGEWNYLTIFASDAKIATWVNGIQVTDWTDERDPDKNPRKGRRIQPGTIQFQGHDPSTDIRFRNIRIGKL